jgi:alginate O-acetyltransferase complex protein AlgI
LSGGMTIQNPLIKSLGATGSILLTFHFVCFCWIFFRASSMEVAYQMISQITTDFNPQIFFEFVSGYKAVVFLMVLGFILHYIPASTEQKAETWVTNLPLTGKAALVVSIIILVVQTKSAGIQPFIYFQF